MFDGQVNKETDYDEHDIHLLVRDAARVAYISNYISSTSQLTTLY